MGHIGGIFIVLYDICHICTQNSVIVFGLVKHVDQIDIEIVGKVHVRIGLHAKILHGYWLKVQVVGLVSMNVIPMDLRFVNDNKY